MSRLREASFNVVEGHSVVVPLAIDGLPHHIAVLGMRWERKREFHMTAVGAAVLRAAAEGRDDVWDIAVRVLSGRSVGPIEARDEVRRVTRPDDPSDPLRTLIVMVDAPGLSPLYRDLSAALGASLSPPPAHVTLYSSDPADGIGIDDERQLEQRAPRLPREDHAQVMDAIRFDEVFRGS